MLDLGFGPAGGRFALWPREKKRGKGLSPFLWCQTVKTGGGRRVGKAKKVSSKVRYDMECGQRLSSDDVKV